MPVSRSSTSSLKAACSVSEMASLVGLSRARFYELVDRGVFLPPVYSLSTQRPMYLRHMQQRNLEVKEEQIGINGDFILFYERRTTPQPRSSGRRTDHHRNLADRLLPQVRALGLPHATAEGVRRALRDGFPDGVNDTDDQEALRAVIRRLRRATDA